MQCMAEVGRLESCKTEVMRRLITEKWSDVQAVCAASHLDPPALPLLYHDALSGNSSPNSGQVRRFHTQCLGQSSCEATYGQVHLQVCCTSFVFAPPSTGATTRYIALRSHAVPTRRCICKSSAQGVMWHSNTVAQTFSQTAVNHPLFKVPHARSAGPFASHCTRCAVAVTQIDHKLTI